MIITRVTVCKGGGADSPRRRALIQRLEANYHLRDSGLEFDPALIAAVDFELESAEAAISKLVRQGVPFDGIVASSELIALGHPRPSPRGRLGAGGRIGGGL